MKNIILLFCTVTVVQFCLLGLVVVSSHGGCERDRLDRIDNANFQRAQASYITQVTAAASVKEDVKKAARIARTTFNRTASRLEKRSHIDCWRVLS